MGKQHGGGEERRSYVNNIFTKKKKGKDFPLNFNPHYAVFKQKRTLLSARGLQRLNVSIILLIVYTIRFCLSIIESG
jgi:hypothetical protein